MKTALFDYHLPQEFIAQTPADPRDASRLLVLHRESGAIEHRTFRDIGEYLRDGDILIANDSRVLPARLLGHKSTGGAVEVFLLRSLDDEQQEWECLVRGRGLGAGVSVQVAPHDPDAAPVIATIVAVNDDGSRHVRFDAPLAGRLESLGALPLPPYITDYHGDAERYQTEIGRAHV